MNVEELKKYPSIRRFEKLVNRGRITTGTYENYVKYVGQYCDLSGYDNPEIALEEIKKIEDKETYFDDLIETLREQKVSDAQIVNIYKGLKRWITLNKVDIDWREIILPSVEVKVEDRAPTKEELKKLLNIASLRTKALILVASSSGMRRNALVTLKVEDVKFDYPDVARVIVKRHYIINGKKFRSGRKISKKRSLYVTFITPEAKAMLEQYLEQRRLLGETISKDSPLFTSIRHKELGNFLSKEYVDTHWGRLLRKAGLDMKSEGHFVLHFHTLKKYAETQFINAGVKPSYREFWLGHKGAYLESSYFRGEEVKHLEEYRKAIDFLSVIEAPIRLTPQKVKETLREILAKEGVDISFAIEKASKKLGITKVTLLDKMLMQAKGKVKKKKANDCQSVINESELEGYLAQGYRFVTTLPSGKIVVED